MRCEWKAKCCTSPRSQERTMSGRKRTLKLGWRELGQSGRYSGIPIAIGIVGMQVMFPPTMATIPTRQAARFFRTCSLTAAIEVGLVRPVVAEFQRSRVPVDVNAKRSLNTTHRFVFAAGAIEDSSALLFHRSFRLNHAVRSKQFDGRENMVCASQLLRSPKGRSDIQPRIIKGTFRSAKRKQI